MSAKLSITFDPATDNKESVIAMVNHMFGLAGILSGGALDTDNDGGTASTATHDNTGLPWDARIHSDPATIKANGTWRAKRNVDKQLVAQVEAELRAGAAAQTTAIGAVTNIPAVGQNGAQPAAAASLAAMPTLAAPAPLAQAPAPAPTTYEQLLKVIGDNLRTAQNPAGRIDDAWVHSALTQYHVPEGKTPNVAAMPEASQQQILAAFKQALGVA